MARFNFWILTIGILLCSCNISSGDNIAEDSDQESLSHTNYGYNIIVAVDLSNRILNSRSYDDPAILALITSKLKELFQKSAELNINSKFFFTTVNDQDLRGFKYNDSIFKIDLTRFKRNISDRAEYLHHAKGKGSLQFDIEALNRNFTTMYGRIKSGKQAAADMWYFLKDKLTYPVIDTTSTTIQYKGINITSKLNNYIILITDGYIEAGRYASNQDMRQGNKFRFLSESLVSVFRNEYKKSKTKSVANFFNLQNYGILPVENEFLSDCKFLVLELYDRSVKNGVNTENPTDMEIMKLFWADWLLKSKVKRENIAIFSCFNNRQNLDQVIINFLK